MPANTFPKKLPLVSVMIPTYNRPEMFAFALESALSQTYPNVEIIVTDNWKKVISRSSGNL